MPRSPHPPVLKDDGVELFIIVAAGMVALMCGVDLSVVLVLGGIAYLALAD